MIQFIVKPAVVLAFLVANVMCQVVQAQPWTASDLVIDGNVHPCVGGQVTYLAQGQHGCDKVGFEVVNAQENVDYVRVNETANSKTIRWLKVGTFTLKAMFRSCGRSDIDRTSTIVVHEIPVPLQDVSLTVTCKESQPIILSVPNYPTDLMWYENVDGTDVLLSSGRELILPRERVAGGYTFKAKVKNREYCLTGLGETYFFVLVQPILDSELMRITSTTYDDKGIVAQGKSYYGVKGEILQSQVKILSKGQVMSTVSVQDKHGRAAVSTLPAPMGRSYFEYKDGFFANYTNNKFTYEDFGANGKLSTKPGTVGGYYSTNNLLEQHVPVTNFPYSQADFYDDGSNVARFVAGPGEVHRLGNGASNEVISCPFPVANELDDYQSKRSIAVPGSTMNAAKIDAVVTIDRDANKRYTATVTDKSGRVLMTAEIGTSTDYDLRVANQYKFRSGQSSNYFYIMEQYIEFFTNSTEGWGDDERFYIDNLGVDESAMIPKKRGSYSFEQGFYKIPHSSTWFELNFESRVYFKNVAYMFYDDAGRLVSAVSPNGHKQWKGGLAYAEIDKSTNVYNFRGILVLSSSPDEGVVRFKSRKDGKLRFSQNAKQQEDGSFSYIHYDQIGRPIESGEAFGTPYSDAVQNGQLEYFDQVYYTAANTRDWLKTYYDFPEEEGPSGLYSVTGLPTSYKQTYVRGAVSKTENAAIQTWYSYDESGRLTWMAQKPTQLNKVFVVAYTYDFLGNILRSASLVYEVGGNGMPSTSFYHHYTYDADKRLDQVFTSLVPEPSDEQKKLQAKYEYYLHGPLKRVELGEELQGIDFVYNIHGWLTQINHPDASLDPGNDGNAGAHSNFRKDVFGMLLNYYESDFQDLFKVSSLSKPKIDPFEQNMQHNLSPVVANMIRPAYMNSASVLEQVKTYRPGDYSAAKPLFREMLNLFFAERSQSMQGYEADAGGTIAFESSASNQGQLVATSDVHQLPVLMNGPERRFLMDFGDPAAPTTVLGWNNMTSGVTGAVSTPLTDTEGQTSSIQVEIVKNASNGFGNGNYYNPDGYDAQVRDYPASAAGDSYFAYGPGGIYKLKGLDPTKYYTLTIFGSRTSTTIPNRVGAYTINAQIKTLSAANNVSETVSFYNLKPSATGEIVMDFGVASGSQFGYVNVFDLIEKASPGIQQPGTLTAEVVARQGVLHWVDNANNETGYYIERRKAGESVFNRIGTAVANAVQYTDLMVSVGQTYEYRVSAYNDTEESLLTNIASLEVPGISDKRYLIDFGNPAFPTNLAGWNNMPSGLPGSLLADIVDSQGTPSSIDFEVIVDASAGFAGDGVYYNSVGYNGQVVDYPASACLDSYFSFGNGGTYRLKNLDPNKLYSITIFGSRVANKNDRTGTFTINGVQQTLAAANNSSRTITFYHMVPDSTGEITLQFGVDKDSFLGYMSVLDISEVTNPIVETPVALTAQGNMNGVTLSWTDGATNETGYRIERKLPGETLFSMIGELGANVTSYIDSKTLTGTAYEYRIYATYGEVYSAFSNIVTLTTPGNPPDRRYLIDFGSPNYTTTDPGWNNITSPLPGYTLSNIIDSNSNSSSISVRIVKVASNGFGNGDVYNTDGYVGTVLDYPISACRDSYFAYGPGGTYKLLGLNPNRFYSITIFGSRTSSVADRTGTYTINGKQYQLAGNSNTSRTITFSNLVPDAAGQLELAFGVASGSTHGYLGVMDIRETTTPTVTAPGNIVVEREGRFATVKWSDNSANETGFQIERRASNEQIFRVVGKTAAGTSQYMDGILATGLSYEYRITSYRATVQPADTTLSAYSGVAATAVPGALARRFLIDFGDPTMPTTEPGWNNMTGAETGNIRFDLIDTKGVSSVISFEIVKNASNNFGDGTPYNSIGYTGPAPVFGYPISATRDSYFAYAGGGIYRLKQLNPNYYYTITIFGSRQATDGNRIGSYIVNGEKKTLDAANNSTRRITFQQVRPTPAGDVVFDFGVEAGSQLGYLSVLDFTEASMPELEPPVLQKSERLAGAGGVKITWLDNTTFEQNYEVYRSTSAGGVFSLLATLPVNTVTYTDVTATANQTYHYRVRGTRTNAVTPYSNALISDNTDNPPVLDPIEDVVVNVESTKEIRLGAYPGGGMHVERKNVVILGSSTAEGYGANPIGNSWASLLEKHLEGYADQGWTVLNIAKYGYTSNDVMPSGDPERNITKALTYNPLLIIVNLPSNDIASGITPATFLSNLTTIKQLADNAGVKMLITTTQPRNAATLADRQVYQSMANTIKSTFGAAAIDLYTPLAAADLTIQAAYNVDGVHVNNAGHGVIYNLIKPNVEAIVNKLVLQYTVSNVPDFAKVIPSSIGARLVLTPRREHLGTYSNVEVTVIDKNGNYAKRNLTIRVLQADEEPSSDYRLKPLYNGLISAAAWRTDSPISDEPLTGMYLYEYDDRYQIKNANWATPDYQGNDFAMQGNRFRLSKMTYDANGNIRSLHRYDQGGVNIHWFDYKYSYDETTPENQKQDNRLQKIVGYVNAYTYNKIGQVIGEDKETGDDQYVEYNVSGKVTKVFRDASKTQLKIQNVYDDRGFRLAKTSYPLDQNGKIRTTWYMRDVGGAVLSVFEQEGQPGIGNTKPLDQTEIPVYSSVKLGTYYPNENGSMTYEITDHLGNVRALIRDNINVYTATMEDSEVENLSNPRVEELQYFENLFTTEVSDAHMNHTPPMTGREDNPDKAAYLYWVDNANGMTTFDRSIGPSITLKVKAGDKIDLKTWARYEERENYTSDLSLAVVSQLVSANLMTMPALDGGAIANQSGSLESLLGDLLETPEDTEQPRAFLNYIVFDENMVSIKADRVQVSEDAGFDPSEVAVLGGHEVLSTSVDIPANGYIYVWVNNTSEGTKVWFDDITVMSTGSLVIQATDYGVWGDVIREQKLDESKYRFGYQGQYAERDDETGWNHFELREFDPIIGRWLVPDPYGAYWSPYLGMGNNPVNLTDPDGGMPDPPGDQEDPADWWNGDPNSYFILPEFDISAPMIDGTYSGVNNVHHYGNWYMFQDNGGEWYKTQIHITGNVTEKFYGGEWHSWRDEGQLLNAHSDNIVKAADVIEVTYAITIGGGLGAYGNLLRNNSMGIIRPTPITDIRRMGSMLETVEDVMVNPKLLEGQPYGYVRMILNDSRNWVNDIMRKSSRAEGWVFREVTESGSFTGRMIQYHPGTPRHFGGLPYWKVSSGRGTFRMPAKP